MRGCSRKTALPEDWQRATPTPPVELQAIFRTKGAWAWARRHKTRFGIESAFRQVGRSELVSPKRLMQLIEGGPCQ